MYLPKSMWLKDDENYEDWTDNITLLLGSRGLARFIKPRTATTTPSSEPSDEDDSLRMTCAMSIKGSIHPEAAVGLKGVTDPAEMMRLLGQRFTSTGWNLKHKYLTEYNTLRVEHYDSIGAFIDQYKVLKSKLDTIGLPLPEEVYTINFIALLDAQYPVWSDRQRSNARRTTPALEDLIADILDESRKAEKATTALYSGKPAKGKKGDEKESVKYGHCKKEGHIEDSCWVKYPEKRPSKGKGAKKVDSKDSDNESDPILSVVALSTRSGLDRHSWCFDGGAALHITHTRTNFDLYTPNNGSLPTVYTANGPARPLGSGIVRLEVEGIDGKPLKLELKDVLHLPSVPVNLFSGQLFEQRTKGGYLKKGVLYTGSDKPVAQIETTKSGYFLKIVKGPQFTYIPKATGYKDIVDTAEDWGLEQGYIPLPKSTTVVEEKDSKSSSLASIAKKNRPQESRNEQKDSEPSTIQLGSEIPSQIDQELPSQPDQGSSDQGSLQAPGGSQSQNPLDLSNRRITRSLTRGNPALLDKPALFVTALLAMQASKELKIVQEVNKGLMYAKLPRVLKGG